MPLELRLPTGFGRVDVPALIQDGALLCRWGDGPFLDDSGTALTVTAAPRGAKSFDEIVALASGGPFFYTAVEVVGPWDRGLAECSPPDGSGFAGVFCAWTVQVGELWVVLELDRLGADQVEANLTGEPLAGVTPREDSAASALVARVVQEIANANIGEVLAVENQLPPCATLADWNLIGDQLGLPLTSLETSSESRGSTSAGVSGQALDEMVFIAMDHQSARSCQLEFGVFDDGARPTYIRVGVVPGGAWAPGTNLWGGLGAERCGPFEGGPICELSSAVGSAGVYVAATGTVYEGVPTKVLAEIARSLG